MEQKTVEQKLSNHVSVFEQSVMKSELWIKELHKDLHWIGADGVYHLLRAVLQTVREQLSIDEAAHLAAQLPMVLRGVFYEGWDPKSLPPKGLGREDFISAVRAKMGNCGEIRYDLNEAIRSALLVIKKHVSDGEMQEVIGALKPTLRSFIAEGEIKEKMQCQ